jgi:radical SAM superfamily enzyme YgiQ (UPF0313 family)
VFSINKQWFLAFAEEYGKRLKIPYKCSFTPKELNEDTVRALKDSGCFSTTIIFETGNENRRIKLLNKKVTNEEYIRAADLLHKYKINFVTNCMLGLPGDTLENIYESIEMNWRLKPYHARSSLFQPYPNTKLAEYAIEEGYITAESLQNFDTGFYSKSLLVQENMNEMVNLQRLFNIASKFPALLPVIKRLVMIPPNPVFNLIFAVIYTSFLYNVNKLSLYQIMKIGLWQFKSFILSKGR